MDEGIKALSLKRNETEKMNYFTKLHFYENISSHEILLWKGKREADRRDWELRYEGWGDIRKISLRFVGVAQINFSLIRTKMEHAVLFVPRHHSLPNQALLALQNVPTVTLELLRSEQIGLLARDHTLYSIVMPHV